MDHRLIALSGPLTGQVLALGEEEVTFGRHPSSSVCLAEAGVSRRHAVVRRRGDGLELIDLDSRHGTFVNGLPVGERVLEDGDRVVIGGSTFLVRLEGEGAAAAGRGAGVELSQSALLHETARSLALGSAVYLAPERLPDDRVSRSLGALLAIAAALQRHRTVRPLADELLDRLLDAVPAARGVVLLLEDDGASFTAAASRARGGSPDTLAVSRTALDRALAERSGLLVRDVGRSARGAWESSESLRAARVHALLCVPLVEDGRALGALYLDQSGDGPERAGGPPFDEHHLELVTAVADLAARPLAAARRWERLERENERLQEAVLGGGLIGESPAMRRVAERIARIAPTESTVLLRGESGTGKEVTARALHRASSRRRGPFVAVNCAALVETLLESELFGHERGAFTGATTAKQGRLEVADGGTLFLDEVGEMPPAQQAKLLRVLEDRTFTRVGGNRSIRVDVRIVAATNRDLEAAVAEGAFRRDLYYRVAVITLTLPPLRERGRDVLLLASHFAERTAAKVGRRVSGFSDAARARLVRYDWPGNVRELANAVEHAVVLGQDEVIRLGDLPESVLEEPPPGETAKTAEGAETAPATYHQALNRLKRHLILEALDAVGGNVTRAAERLDLHPNHLHRLMTNLGLREELG